MNYKRITIIALAIILLFSASSFAWVQRDARILSVKQDAYGIYIKFETSTGWSPEKVVDAPGIEKNILAIALTAQSSGMLVDVGINAATGAIESLTIVTE